MFFLEGRVTRCKVHAWEGDATREDATSGVAANMPCLAMGDRLAVQYATEERHHLTLGMPM